jgi:flavin-binding protein dodecin
MVVKVLDLVGTSRESWQQAAENAVREAARTVDHITGIEIANMTADVEDGEITCFNANVKLAFAVDGDRRGGRART